MTCRHSRNSLLWYDGSIHCFDCNQTWHDREVIAKEVVNAGPAKVWGKPDRVGDDVDEAIVKGNAIRLGRYEFIPYDDVRAWASDGCGNGFMIMLSDLNQALDNFFKERRQCQTPKTN